MGRKLTWQPFVFGGLASVTAECGTFPIDTTKTRLQIQGQRIDPSLTQLKYRGMLHALARIVREEGVPALYSGIVADTLIYGTPLANRVDPDETAPTGAVSSGSTLFANSSNHVTMRIAPALLRQASYGTIKIGVYHYMKRIFADNEDQESLPVNVFCGIVAGIVSSSVANPTDVLKVRMQARSSMKGNETMLSAFHDIFNKEGLPGLWRGVAQTAQRAAIVVGVELPCYDVIKRYLITHGWTGDTKANHFVSSFFAGMTGAIASTPVDVVKTRLMNQRKLKASVLVNGAVPAIYTSSFDCLSQTVRNEGFLALYKGFIPNWLRLGPWNIIFFMTYEQMKKVEAGLKATAS